MPGGSRAMELRKLGEENQEEIGAMIREIFFSAALE